MTEHPETYMVLRATDRVEMIGRPWLTGHIIDSDGERVRVMTDLGYIDVGPIALWRRVETERLPGVEHG